MVHRHLCNNSEGEMWVTAVCGTGVVDTIMGWISHDKIAKQVSQTDLNVIVVNRCHSHVFLGGVSVAGSGSFACLYCRANN